LAEAFKDDGGREKAGYKGSSGDCVVRAIAIATRTPYKKVYTDLFEINRTKSGFVREGKNPSPRNGATTSKTIREYLTKRGWVWTPTMGVGTGCKVHLRAEELPGGTVIAVVTRHLTTLIDGVIHDNYDPSRFGTRCVYGYFTHPDYS